MRGLTMYVHILSLRITDEEVYEWLRSKKTRELSINTVIMQALRKEMKADQEAGK